MRRGIVTYIGVDVDGDMFGGVDVVDKFAEPGGYFQHATVRRNIASKPLPA